MRIPYGFFESLLEFTKNKNSNQIKIFRKEEKYSLDLLYTVIYTIKYIYNGQYIYIQFKNLVGK